MNNRQFQIRQKQHQYDLLKPVNMSNLAPRQGFYLIMNISVQVIAGVNCKIARCLWKHNESEDFDLDFHVTIQLKSLEGIHAIGPKHKLTGYLLKSVIHIMKANVVAIKEERVFYVEWDLLNNAMSFPTGSFSDDNEHDNELSAAIANSTDEDIELINAINAQLDMNDEVMQAILRQEDNAFEEYESTNDLIYALQAQNLPNQK
jgi:hypothetical protein